MGKATSTIKESMVAKGQAPIDPFDIYPKIDAFDFDYMSTNEVVENFLSFCVSAIKHHKENETTQNEREGDQEDLLHEIELSPLKSAFNGYRIYRKLKEIRQERRRCKDENEMTWPLVEFLTKNPQFISELERIQKMGDSKKASFSKRRYSPRGNVLKAMGF